MTDMLTSCVIRHLHILVRAAIALREPAILLQHLFYIIADVCTCAINAAIHFIVAYVLFYCT